MWSTRIFDTIEVEAILLFRVCIHICDRLQENRAQRGMRKYREKNDRFLKNVLFQADRRERLGLL